MAPNPRVMAAFKAMKGLGIIEEKVKPVLKNLLKLYDKNWELIEEESYRVLADAIFDQEEAQAAEKKKHENIDQEGMDDVQEPEEPERPLKRLRLRNQEGHVSPSFGNSSPRDGTSLRQPKVEGAKLLETCSQHQEMTESSQANIENVRAGSHALSPQPLHRNKGKQPVLPDPLAVQERFEPSQPVAADSAFDRDRMQPVVTKSTESDTVSPAMRLREKGKEPLSPHIAPQDKKSISQNSYHALRLKEPNVGASVMFVPKQQGYNSHALIKPKDEPITDDLPQYEVPLQVIHPEPSRKENSSSGKGSSREPAGTESLFLYGEDRSDGVLASSSERRTSCELANIADDSNVEISSPASDKVMVDLRPAVDLSKQSQEQDDLGAKGNPFGPSSRSATTHCAAEADRSLVRRLQPSSKGIVDGIQINRNTTENTSEIGLEREQNGLESENSCGDVVVRRHKPIPGDGRSPRDVNDITRGQEKIVVSLVNDINNDVPPSFRYIAKNVVFQNAYVNFSLARIGESCCSTCSGNCLSSSTPCACAHTTGDNFAYTTGSIVKENFLEECISMTRDPQKHHRVYCRECPLERLKNEAILEPCKGHLVRKFIKECWWKCGCSNHCGNRVVQRGISCNLQVFMTPEGKGWGLRTLGDLPKGAFVCEYVGEILTSAELHKRMSQSPNSEEHLCPLQLDADWGSKEGLKNEEALCLDATFYGNVARLINHRCFDSNLVEIPVEVETPDRHYYHLALFTTRNVEALEELTWDYGIDFDDLDHPVKSFKCRCGSTFCRNIQRSDRSRSAAKEQDVGFM